MRALAGFQRDAMACLGPFESRLSCELDQDPGKTDVAQQCLWHRARFVMPAQTPRKFTKVVMAALSLSASRRHPCVRMTGERGVHRPFTIARGCGELSGARRVGFAPDPARRD